MDIDNRTEVPYARLTRAVADLVTRRVLTREQADAVLAEVGEPPGAATAPAHRAEARSDLRPLTDRVSWTSVLAEVGGYVGAAFVAAAAVVLTGPRWDELETAARLAVFAVPAVLMSVAAGVVAATTAGGWPVHARRGQGARRRLVSALVLVAGGLAAGVAAVLVEDDSEQNAWVAATAAVAWLAGYLACRTALLHLGAAIGLAWTGVMGWGLFFTGDFSPLAPGGSLVVIGVAWAAAALVGWLDERALGLTVAGGIVFVGGEMLTLWEEGGGLGYAVLAALAVAGLVGYVTTRHVAVLAVGVVALATVVPQAIIDYTDGSLGAAGALLVTGLSIVGASTLGLRLHRTTREDRPSDGLAARG